MNAEEMYQEIILDNYRNPKNFGTVENPTIHARDSNPACGDVIEINIKINKDRVEEIKFTGKGCAISQAAASMLTEEVKGKNVEYIHKLRKEQILEMLGIPLSGIRLKCALLSLKVLKVGTYSYLGEKLEDDYA